MARRTAIVVYAEGSVVDVLRAAPILDRAATRELVVRLFPGADVEECGDALLIDGVDPPDGVVYAGAFPGVEIICSRLLVAERPSILAARIGADGSDRTVLVHAMGGSDEWCAFAAWERGQLVRAVSVLAGGRLVENVGEPLSFEGAYWAGECGLDGYGERALRAFFGFALHEAEHLDDVDPEVIPLVGYRVR
jgi:hypothetical protein